MWIGFYHYGIAFNTLQTGSSWSGKEVPEKYFMLKIKP
jgi:hypothetical protein